MFGCSPAAKDLDAASTVLTVDCPTVGNIWITLIGANLIGEFDVFLGGVRIPFSEGSVNLSTSNSSLQFKLPPGTGQSLSVKVCNAFLFLHFSCVRLFYTFLSFVSRFLLCFYFSFFLSVC